MRIWRLMADWETCSFSPAAVKDPVSAIARMISSCLRSMSQHTCGLLMNLLATIRSRDRGGWLEGRARAFHRLVEISLVHFNPDETQTELGAGDRRGTKAKKWIGD